MKKGMTLLLRLAAALDFDH